MMLLQGVGTKPDPVRSAKIFEEQCQKQNAGACANLAMQVYLGVGTARDLKRAATLSEAACKANMLAACNTLAGILVEQGGDDNMQRAETLFTAICNQPNSAGACDNLGQLYARGVGSKPPDKDKAAAIFKKACDDGFAKSCTHLAQLMSSP
jgi:TPR repeat protein